MAPVERLVSEVMSQQPYKSARRVFWIMDNCSAHRGQKAVDRYRAKWPQRGPHPHSGPRQLAQSGRNLFLNCPEEGPYPNDFSSLAELDQRLLAFQSHYERTATPFKWTFTRNDLHALLAKIAAKRLAPAA